MPEASNQRQRNVSHDEFAQFAESVDRRFIKVEDRIDSGFSNVNDKLETLFQRQASSGTLPTTWILTFAVTLFGTGFGVIAACVSAAWVIATMLTAPNTIAIESVDGRQTHQAEVLATFIDGSHATLKAQAAEAAATAEKIETLRAQIDSGVLAHDSHTKRIAEVADEARLAVADLDTRLQREMRDLDATQTVQIEALDTRLQREMRDLLSAANARTEENAHENDLMWNMIHNTFIPEIATLQAQMAEASTTDEAIADLRERVALITARMNTDQQ